MKLRLILPIALITGLTLISCGGSGGGDDPAAASAAVISTANEEALATAATEAAKAAVSSDSLPNFGFRTGARSLELAVVQDYSSSLCTDGGSVIVDVNENTGNGVVTYTNCSFSGVIINGIVNFNTTVAGDISTTTISYTNFTMVYAGETHSFDLTMVCQTNSSTLDSSCTFNSESMGIDGRTYSVSDVSVSGDDFNGYTVSATVTDPDYGYLSITTNSPVTFNCTNGQPGSGEIQFNDGDDNRVLVTFTGCNSYTVSYNGTSNAYSW